MRLAGLPPYECVWLVLWRFGHASPLLCLILLLCVSPARAEGTGAAPAATVVAFLHAACAGDAVAALRLVVPTERGTHGAWALDAHDRLGGDTYHLSRPGHEDALLAHVRQSACLPLDALHAEGNTVTWQQSVWTPTAGRVSGDHYRVLYRATVQQGRLVELTKAEILLGSGLPTPTIRSPATGETSSTSPVLVLLDLNAAMHAFNAEHALALFAEDATLTVPWVTESAVDGPGQRTVHTLHFRGKTQIESYLWSSLEAGHTWIEITDIAQHGTLVSWEGQQHATDNHQRFGRDPVPVQGTARIEDGQIVALTGFYAPAFEATLAPGPSRPPGTASRLERTSAPTPRASAARPPVSILVGPTEAGWPVIVVGVTGLVMLVMLGGRKRARVQRRVAGHRCATSASATQIRT